jgi:nicotinamide-nucleotide amidase
MVPDTLLSQADIVLAACRARGVRIVTAESLTGGLIAATLTAAAGASDVVDRGFITYSNQSKTDMIGVPADLIARHGAVSEDVARAMADGALARARADIAIAVTGLAGPGGGSPAKPVGTVCFGLAATGRPPATERQVFTGDRAAIRAATVGHALAMLLRAVEPSA